MRVYIGPYRKWWGPYQLTGMIPFLSEYRKEMIGDWIAETWINYVCEWFYSKTERKIKVRIDRYDTWSMDHTLALIILPMLKQIKETKHGSPYVDDEDVPAHMRHTFIKDPDDYETNDPWVHYKWEWILNEMIWAFETHLNESWEDQFRNGDPDIDWDLVSGVEGEESAMYKMKQKNPDYWVDYVKIREYNDRIDNGFRLFGKYYRNLWD